MGTCRQFAIPVDLASALSALTRTYAGVSVLRALKILVWTRISMCPPRNTPRRELNSVSRTEVRNILTVTWLIAQGHLDQQAVDFDVVLGGDHAV
jgi:hypothetical protein